MKNARIALGLLLAGLLIQGAAKADEIDPRRASDEPCAAAAGDAPTKDGWYRQTLSDTVIVFVHGILSDSRAAWLTSKAPCQYWPALVASDTANFGRPNIFLGGYYSGHDSGAAGIRDVAGQLFAALESPAGSPAVAPLAHRRIVFVAHSLGGIVVRKMLVDRASEFANHDVSVVLYASPAGGSPYADLLAWLEKYYPNALLRDLKSDAASLEELNTRFRQFLADRHLQGRRVRVAEFFESRFIKQDCTLWWFCSIVTAQMGEIVPAERAGNFDVAALRLPDTDHLTIVKPRTLHDDPHRRLAQTLRAFDVEAAAPFAPSLGQLSVSGVERKGDWEPEGAAADLLTLVGSSLCDHKAADVLPPLCRERHEVRPYGQPPKDGDLGFAILAESTRNLSGTAQLSLVTFPGQGAAEWRATGKPVLFGISAVLKGFVPSAEGAITAMHATRYQPLRYKMKPEEWSSQVAVPGPGSVVDLAVPANVEAAEVTENGIAGRIKRRLVDLQTGGRLGLLELRDTFRRGEEMVYRFVVKPRIAAFR